MQRLSVLDLNAIATVAETGSFRKSALRLGIGQPAISRRVARVEDMIGVSLFERRLSGARLTVAGRVFVGRARGILNDLTAALDAARSAGEAKTGELRIGLIASPSKGTLRCVIEEFLIRHPDVRLSFTEAERSELLSLLNHREIDVFIATGTNSLAIGDTMLLDEERTYLAVPSNSHLAVKTQLTWTDVEDETYLVSTREAGQDLHDYILRRISDFGTPVRLQWHRLSREGIMTLVGLGLGVSLIADHWRGASYPNVTFVRIGEADERVPFSLVWRPENDNPALRRFVSLARVQAKETASSLSEASRSPDPYPT